MTSKSPAGTKPSIKLIGVRPRKMRFSMRKQTCVRCFLFFWAERSSFHFGHKQFYSQQNTVKDKKADCLVETKSAGEPKKQKEKERTSQKTKTERNKKKIKSVHIKLDNLLDLNIFPGRVG